MLWKFFRRSEWETDSLSNLKFFHLWEWIINFLSEPCDDFCILGYTRVNLFFHVQRFETKKSSRLNHKKVNIFSFCWQHTHSRELNDSFNNDSKFFEDFIASQKLKTLEISMNLLRTKVISDEFFLNYLLPNRNREIKEKIAQRSDNFFMTNYWHWAIIWIKSQNVQIRCSLSNITESFD